MIENAKYTYPYEKQVCGITTGHDGKNLGKLLLEKGGYINIDNKAAEKKLLEKTQQKLGYTLSDEEIKKIQNKPHWEKCVDLYNFEHPDQKDQITVKRENDEVKLLLNDEEYIPSNKLLDESVYNKFEKKPCLEDKHNNEDAVREEDLTEELRKHGVPGATKLNKDQACIVADRLKYKFSDSEKIKQTNPEDVKGEGCSGKKKSICQEEETCEWKDGGKIWLINEIYEKLNEDDDLFDRFFDKIFDIILKDELNNEVRNTNSLTKLSFKKMDKYAFFRQFKIIKHLNQQKLYWARSLLRYPDEAEVISQQHEGMTKKLFNELVQKKKDDNGITDYPGGRCYKKNVKRDIKPSYALRLRETSRQTFNNIENEKLLDRITFLERVNQEENFKFNEKIENLKKELEDHQQTQHSNDDSLKKEKKQLEAKIKILEEKIESLQKKKTQSDTATQTSSGERESVSVTSPTSFLSETSLESVEQTQLDALKEKEAQLDALKKKQAQLDALEEQALLDALKEEQALLEKSAATMIQAAQRGKMARVKQDILKEKQAQLVRSAATVIQKAQRGKMARGKLDILKVAREKLNELKVEQSLLEESTGTAILSDTSDISPTSSCSRNKDQANLDKNKNLIKLHIIYLHILKVIKLSKQKRLALSNQSCSFILLIILKSFEKSKPNIKNKKELMDKIKRSSMYNISDHLELIKILIVEEGEVEKLDAKKIKNLFAHLRAKEDELLFENWKEGFLSDILTFKNKIPESEQFLYFLKNSEGDLVLIEKLFKDYNLGKEYKLIIKFIDENLIEKINEMGEDLLKYDFSEEKCRLDFFEKIIKPEIRRFKLKYIGDSDNINNLITLLLNGDE